MRIIMLPDANYQAIRLIASRLLDLISTDLDPAVAGYLRRIEREIGRAQDPRCPDHHGRHRIRLDHMRVIHDLTHTVEQEATKRGIDLLSDLLWNVQFIRIHTAPDVLAVFEVQE